MITSPVNSFQCVNSYKKQNQHCPFLKHGTTWWYLSTRFVEADSSQYYTYSSVLPAQNQTAKLKT